MFVGEWRCGNTWITISKTDREYDVYIIWRLNEDLTYEWDYTCVLDADARMLTGTGSKGIDVEIKGTDTKAEAVSTYMEHAKGEKDSRLFTLSDEYTDGKASFTLDGDSLLWNDVKENAGEGMVFSRLTGSEE